MSSSTGSGANGRPTASATASPAASGQSPEEIQRDIEQTRAHLGRTAGALAHKLDPKAQAKERMTQARRATQHAAQDLYRERPAVVIGVAVAAVVLAAVIWRRNS